MKPKTKTHKHDISNFSKSLQATNQDDWVCNKCGTLNDGSSSSCSWCS